ncbi:inositol monophosphatase family protein [Aquiflexum gelatinilyticum]|uniref:inositol monophosphatase family protein n=1 Tax=Aquiflexum gelatinilyticum TaxID=2961943 RepID=UPI00216816E1|nr:inositol monophosphatase family protein [Aquiflexum gelatinilyticum]MCS4435555.1 inositol monophosphatase [Aquiflexum gelatinilyticum]
MIDLLPILQQTEIVAKEAGAFIRKERQSFDLNKVEQKGLNDLVSYVDKEAEKIIVDRLSRILPEADFITEEGTGSTDGKEYTWIIDPLDGTTNFIHGLPIFSVSIGLKFHDEIVLGVVYEINFDECFYAVKGKGAFCNGKPIHVSPAKTLGESLIGTGFPYSAFGQIDNYLSVLRLLMEKCHGLRRMGSAAVDLCYVACGRQDGFFEYDLKPYDVAAGIIIIQEAGGRVSDFEMGDDYLFGKKIVATNGLIHDELGSDIQKIWKK